ncbi:MAG: M23 family metallopeptidase [Gammaproteobacteria bacterium]|nr:M23 family metallopeptidase [Gammaproteobacteria bacterium]
MHLTILHKSRSGVRYLHASRSHCLLIAFALFLALPVLSATIAWKLARSQGTATDKDLANSAWMAEMEAQKRALAEAKASAELQLDTLTAKLGMVQAQAVRLDALSERLTQAAGLDADEFRFETAMGMGGPASELKKKLEVYDFVQELERLSAELSTRGENLNALETVLVKRTLEDEQSITGRPVEGAHLSSHFGLRGDPFDGGHAWHEGVDFAGAAGSDVTTTAGGIVVFAGKSAGYGNLVEVSHGNGMTTRYGHNQELLVAVGDIVRKGQVIAKMGSTGRSTGPHVHYEVLKNGNPMNPKSFLDHG